MTKYYVYQLKTTACNKYYIGVTNNPSRRLKDHLNQENLKWKKLTKCGRAVKRYGACTFNMRILETCLTDVEAKKLEVKWIARFGMKRLWNSNKGGAGGSPKGRKFSNEAKNNMSEAFKGRKFSKEHRKNLSLAAKARKIMVKNKEE